MLRNLAQVKYNFLFIVFKYIKCTCFREYDLRIYLAEERYMQIRFNNMFFIHMRYIRYNVLNTYVYEIIIYI